METKIADFIMQCFGGFHLEVNQKTINKFSTDKARALLVYLAVEAPLSFRRSHLAGLFWSDFREDQALHNLRQTLVWLKKAVPDVPNQPPLLIIGQDMIGINPERRIWVDVNAFQSACQSALNFSSRDHFLDEVDILGLKNAIQLFKGPFLDRFNLDESPLFDEWVLAMRESTNQRAAEVLAILCTYHERRGEYDQACQCADRIITLAPWDETAYVRSMRYYAMLKQWAPAKKRYVQLRTYLKQSFSIEPVPAVNQLYEEIRRRSLDDLPLPAIFTPFPSSLPKPSSAFIGRKREIKTLTGMLADPKTRLVSLLGMGGIGKSRLAIEVGQLLQGLYVDGVFFIALSESLTYEGTIHSIAENIGLSFSGASAHQDQLISYLREKRCLLILDGFEQLHRIKEISGLITTLFKQSPGVKLLITSREPLNLVEEHILQLQGLETGSAAQPRSTQEGTPPDALALFESRARQIDHQFEINDQTLQTAEKLCHFVEGHPLSIELLAANTRINHLSNLLAEIESRLLTIQSPMINVSSEQKNLAVVLEGSWSTLNQRQQETLAKLACFRRSFSIDAALAVTRSSKADLFILQEKCLLRSVPDDRFILHEIIRQFAHHKLIKANLSTSSFQAHAEYYLSILDNLAAQKPDQDLEEILNVIDKDYENLIIAWQFFVKNGELQRLLKSIEPLNKYFNIRSRFQEGISLFQEATQAAHDNPPANIFSTMCAIRTGFLAHRLHLNELALEMFLRGKDGLSQGEDERELGLALMGMGSIHLRAKHFNLALENAQAGLAIFQKTNDTASQANAFELLGLIYNRTANFGLAKEMLTQSIALSRHINDHRGMISTLNQLGDLACNEGDFEKAEAYFLESLAYSRSFKDRFNQAILLNNLASVYRPQQAYDREEQVLLESIAICRDIGDRDGEAIALNNLGELAVVLGQYQQAIHYCNQSLEIALQIGEDWTIIINDDILGEAYLQLGQADAAYAHFTRAVEVAYRIQSWDLLTRVIVNAAGVFRMGGDQTTARRFLEAAVSHSGIIFEFEAKAVDWLAEMGISPPGEKNDNLLMALLKDHFDLG